MKVLSLNTWNGGKAGPTIIPFIERWKDKIDIFCFQEAEVHSPDIFASLYDEFECFSEEKRIGDSILNQKTFVRKTISVRETGSVLQDREGTGFGLWVVVETPTTPLYVCNYHGYAFPGHKMDTEERIHASQSLIDAAAIHKGKSVLIGDFNLERDTRSVTLFEDQGFVNCIRTYNIETTRNNLAWDRYPDAKQYYADYAFVSGELEIEKFEVLPDIVSDHLPLLLLIK